MVFDQPADRIDRLEPGQRIAGRRLEGAIEGGRQPLIRRDCHIVGLRRGRASSELGGANERVEGPDRAAREVVKVIALTNPGLVVSNVGVAADVDQPAGGIVNRQGQVTPEAVGIVDVKDGRPGLATVVVAEDALDVFVVEAELVPVDIALAGDRTGHTDGVAVAGQQVAELLRRSPAVVGINNGLTCRPDQWRVVRQADDVDADGWIANIGEADG